MNMDLNSLTEKVFKILLEKFGVKMGDAEHTGPGVPDEGDLKDGIYGKKRKKKKANR
jgi:hypothetical protein